VNRRLVAIAFGAAVLLLALWFLLLWSPQGNKLSDAKKRTDAAQAENSTLELRLARLQAAQKDAPELMAQGEQLRRAIPETPELAQFILDANDAASAAGVDFLSISPTPPVPGVGAAPAEVHLSIAVTGTYFEVLDYLDRLNDLPRVVVIDTLGLTPGGGASASPDQMSVSIAARMFTTQAPAPKVTKAKPGSTGTTTSTVPGATTTSSSVPSANETVTTSTSTAPQITVSANNG
jgi:type IV pilus assembly protein PilO